MINVKQLVRKIIDEHPRSYFNILRGKKYSDIWKQIVLEYIMRETSHLLRCDMKRK